MRLEVPRKVQTYKSTKVLTIQHQFRLSVNPFNCNGLRTQCMNLMDLFSRPASSKKYLDLRCPPIIYKTEKELPIYHGVIYACIIGQRSK